MTRAVPSSSTVSCVGYIRVSTEDQAREERTSLADQRAAIQLLAQRLSVPVAHVFEDAGVSGGTADRPAFTALIAFCRANPRMSRSPGYVLALNDSRWGRFADPEDAAYYRMECKHHGWVVRFAEGDESQDPFARGILRAVHSIQASAYRESIKANAKRGARGSAAQGFWLNEAPFGYRRMTIGGGRPGQVLDVGQRKAPDQKVKLTPGPAEEVETIRWMYDTYAAGRISLIGMRSELLKRWPGRRWSVNAVGKMLKNRTYLGDVIWCRRPHDRVERAEVGIRPMGEWVITPEAHPPLISAALYDAVQGRMAQNAKHTRATAGGYPLSGLIHCAQCGEPYTGGGGPKGPEGDPDRYRFYKCRGGSYPLFTCTGFLGTLQKRWVEPIVIDTIAEIIEQPAVRRQLAAAIDRVLQGMTADDGSHRRRLEAERDRAEATRQRLIRAIADGTLKPDEVAQQLEAVRTDVTRLSSELERHRFVSRRLADVEAEKERLLALALDFRGQAARMSGAALRDLIAPWIANAVVDKQKRELQLSIRRVPGVMNLLQSTNQEVLSGRKQKVRLVETRVIPLPKTAWVKRRKVAR